MKKILDACCGSRMCWFDKDNPDTVFMDCRSEEHTLCDGRRLEIRPDVVGDFRKMPFPDNSFYLVLFEFFFDQLCAQLHALITDVGPAGPGNHFPDLIPCLSAEGTPYLIITNPGHL